MNLPALVPLTRLAGSIMIAAVFVVQDLSPAAAQENTLESYRARIETLEQGIKDVRGTLERDLYAIRQAIENNQGLSGDDLVALRNQIDKLGDELSSVNNRLERTLSAVSDNEFRLLRMEKRLESLMRLSIDRSLDSTAATGPSNTGAGAVPGASLSASEDKSSVWTMNADDLDNSLTDQADADASETSELPQQPVSEETALAVGAETAEPEAERVLPDANPEDQYQFALGKALQNDLATAEAAFEEFTRYHENHERTADAHFWLGRVQFKRGAYEKSVMTFSNFQTQWPNDARVEKTTLWIGEAVSNFAPKEDVCDLLTSLPSFVPNPSENFFVRLDKLKTQAACSS